MSKGAEEHAKDRLSGKREEAERHQVHHELLGADFPERSLPHPGGDLLSQPAESLISTAPAGEPAMSTRSRSALRVMVKLAY